MKTAVQQRSQTGVDEVRAFLRLNTKSYDPILETIMEAAKEQADTYLNNDFLKDDGTKGPIPKSVELFVLQFCATVFSHPKLAIKQTQTVNLGSEILQDVYLEAYNFNIGLLKGRRKLPGISTR